MSHNSFTFALIATPVNHLANPNILSSDIDFVRLREVFTKVLGLSSSKLVVDHAGAYIDLKAYSTLAQTSDTAFHDHVRNIERELSFLRRDQLIEQYNQSHHPVIFFLEVAGADAHIFDWLQRISKSLTSKSDEKENTSTEPVIIDLEKETTAELSDILRHEYMPLIRFLPCDFQRCKSFILENVRDSLSPLKRKIFDKNLSIIQGRKSKLESVV